MPGEFDDLEDLQRRFKKALAAKYGLTALRMKVWVAESDEPMQWLFPRNGELPPLTGAQPPPVGAPAPEPPESSGDVEEHDQRHSKCSDDILAVLRAAKKPLTTTLIMSALSKGKKEWSQRYVEKLLAQMVKDGTLENPEGARPRGYRLPPERAEEDD